jgi:hypothetical protein
MGQRNLFDAPKSRIAGVITAAQPRARTSEAGVVRKQPTNRSIGPFRQQQTPGYFSKLWLQCEPTRSTARRTCGPSWMTCDPKDSPACGAIAAQLNDGRHLRHAVAFNVSRSAAVATASVTID